ncbi:MAG: hypothetical protein J6D54_00025, partial [Olsenella sp.]|nr:hypothetical protein [Olsenella sp.]
MSFNIVRSTDEGLLGSEAEASVRRALASFGRATVFVPSYQMQLDVSREMADRGGLALGVGVTTPEAWATERWEVWGDGTRVVGPLVRASAMQGALLEESRFGRSTVSYNAGT